MTWSTHFRTGKQDWQQHIFYEIDPVKNGWLEIRGNCNHHVGIRIHVNDISAIANGRINSFPRMNDPPEIPIRHPAEVFAFIRLWSGHLLYPRKRNNLPALPNAFLEAQLTDFGHIRCAHAKSVSRSSQSLRVSEPDILLRFFAGGKLYVLFS